MRGALEENLRTLGVVDLVVESARRRRPWTLPCGRCGCGDRSRPRPIFPASRSARRVGRAAPPAGRRSTPSARGRRDRRRQRARRSSTRVAGRRASPDCSSTRPVVSAKMRIMGWALPTPNWRFCPVGRRPFSGDLALIVDSRTGRLSRDHARVGVGFHTAADRRCVLLSAAANPGPVAQPALRLGNRRPPFSPVGSG